MEVKKNEEVALFGEVPNGFKRGTKPNLKISLPEQICQELGRYRWIFLQVAANCVFPYCLVKSHIFHFVFVSDG